MILVLSWSNAFLRKVYDNDNDFTSEIGKSVSSRANASYKQRAQCNAKPLLFSGVHMSFDEVLLAKYGPLMTLPDLAETLKRSVEGVRNGLTKDMEPYRKIREARVRIGRRVYFQTLKIAAIILGE